MVFGEIVEPSTRALLIEDEDLENIPDYEGPKYEWIGSNSPPESIEAIIILETQKALEIVSSLIQGKEPVSQIKDEGLLIYEIDNKYLVLFNGKSKNLVLGEVVEILSPWINKAKKIDCITTELINNLQPAQNYRDVVSITKCLTNNDNIPTNFCEKLEIPNLIQGLGATVLSYCVHCNLKANLWIIYTDLMPLDSVNGSELIRLLKGLGFAINVNFKAPSLNHNLYM